MKVFVKPVSNLDRMCLKGGGKVVAAAKRAQSSLALRFNLRSRRNDDIPPNVDALHLRDLFPHSAVKISVPTMKLQSETAQLYAEQERKGGVVSTPRFPASLCPLYHT